MIQKATKNTIKKLIEQAMKEAIAEQNTERGVLKSNLRKRLNLLFFDKIDMSDFADTFAQAIKRSPSDVTIVKSPSFMKSLYDDIKDVALGGYSLDSFGGLLRSGKISLDETMNLIDSFYEKISMIDEVIRVATEDVKGGNRFQKFFVKKSLEDIYSGIDKAFNTSFVSAYGNSNKNLVRMKIDIENLFILSKIDADDSLDDSDIALTLLKGPEEIKFLSKFIKRYLGKNILDTNIENMLQKAQTFREKYIDGSRTGGFKQSAVNNIDVALDSEKTEFTGFVNASSVLKDAIDSLVSELVGSVAGIDSSERDTLKTINEDTSEFEIEDMEKFFLDPTKKSNQDRELKSKIKIVFDQANNWVDRNIPDELSLLRNVIKRKIEASISDIRQSGNTQAINDLENPAFDAADRADLSVSTTPDFNLGDLYNIDNKSGKRLTNAFRKLTTLEGSSIPLRIKTLESFLPRGGTSADPVPSLGSGKMSNFLAGAAISKLVVDYFGSGVSQEVGYDFENFLSMLLGGNRSGSTASTTTSTTMGTFDIAFIDPETGNPTDISAKSVVIDSHGRLSFTQARSNINADLAGGGTVPYIIALKDATDFKGAGVTEINVDFYALELYVLPGQTITNDSSDQKAKIGVRPYKQQHTGITKKTGRSYQGGEYTIGKASGDYKINLNQAGVTPFAEITVPTKEQFQTNAKARMDSFDADLTKIFSNMRKLKNNVEDFLMGDDSDESLAKGSEAADAYIELQALINSTFFMKDQDLQLQDPSVTDRTDKMGRVGVKGDLEKVTSESLITPNFLKKLIEESFKK